MYNKASLTLHHTRYCTGDYLHSSGVREKGEIFSGGAGFCRNTGRQKVNKKKVK